MRSSVSVYSSFWLNEQDVSGRDAKPRRAARRVQYIAGIALFIALVFQLAVRLTVIEHGYGVEASRSEILAQDLTLRRLKLRYAELSEPQALMREAQLQLEMTRALPQTVRRLEVELEAGMAEISEVES